MPQDMGVPLRKGMPMHHRKILLSFALVTALAATGAFAAEAEHDQHHPAAARAAAANPPASMAGMPSGGAGNMPMMGMMQNVMSENLIAAHVERRIAFLKAELNITEAQQPLWDAVAEALRTNAKPMPEMSAAMIAGSGALPEKLATHEKAVSAHLDAVRRLRTAFDPLYAAFSAAQQKAADALIIEPRSVMGMGMM